jgi:hypothetical protein
MKETASGAPQRFRDFDPHHAELEQFVDERSWNLRVFVHLADEGLDFSGGKLADALAKELLVLCQM